MLSKIIVSVAVTAVLFAAPLDFATRSCILSSAPAQQACKPASCANKTCCATSSEHKSTPAHQLAKADSSYDVNAAFVASAVTVPPRPAVASQKPLLSNASVVAHSSPALAVLCSFLI
ncbi:MAG: hypothetical protein DMF00_11945 [Verrucomicrobia bacterium]|nr:MAG: hypothetical protein DMF00_11945 [Verrucomicrobiota bacterium]